MVPLPPPPLCPRRPSPPHAHLAPLRLEPRCAKPRFKGKAGGLKLFGGKPQKGWPEELHAALKELLPQLPPDALNPPPLYESPATVSVCALSELRREHRVWLPPGPLQCNQHARRVPSLISTAEDAYVLAPIQPVRYVRRRHGAAGHEGDASERTVSEMISEGIELLAETIAESVGGERAAPPEKPSAAAMTVVGQLGLHKHPLAKTLVARKLLKRLVDDATALAESEARGNGSALVLREGLVASVDVIRTQAGMK